MKPESSVFESAPLEQEKPLYPYQEDMLGAILDARNSGTERTYIDSATGSGKDFVIARSVRHFIDENPSERILYLAHNRFVLNQAAREISEVNPAITQGRMFGGEFQDQEQITYATFQTQNRQLGGGRVYEAYSPKEYDTVIVNESHHGPAPTYRPVIEHYSPGLLLGATATAERRDQQDIRDIFGDPAYILKLEEAIAKGYLAKPDYHVLTDQIRHLDELADRPKGVSRKDIEEMNGMVFVPKRDEEITRTIEDYLDKIDDPRTIIFCSSIQQTEYFSQLLSGESTALHSDLSDEEQDKRLEAFRVGEMPTLLVVDMLNEAVDVPEINTVVFLRSTESKTVFFQQLGRGLRKVPGKDHVTVLDFVANWDRLSTLQNLQTDIQSHRQVPSRTLEPREIEADIKFNFSSEAMKAVEVVQEARKRERHKEPKPKKTPRLDKWAEEEAELKAMLGVDKLSRQKMTQSDWQHYAERIVSGDEKAVEELVLQRLRFAYGRAKKYAETLGSREITLEEHFHHAIIGIHEGIERYNPDKSSSLEQEITWGVRTALRLIPKDQRLLGSSHSVYTLFEKTQKTREKLAKELGVKALDISINDDAFSKISGIPPEQLADMQLIQDALDYESLEPIESASEIVDDNIVDSPHEKAMAFITKDILKNALEWLSYRERRVLELRYGLGGEQPYALDEVGKTFNVTRESVRRIQDQSLKKLEVVPEAQSLRTTSDEEKRLAPKQQEKQRLAEMRREVRTQLARAASRELVGIKDEQLTEQIRQEDGYQVGSLALLITRVLPVSNIPTDKHRLVKRLEDRYLTRSNDHHISHVDYVRALNALERHRVVRLQRNERGTVIESVSRPSPVYY